MEVVSEDVEKIEKNEPEEVKIEQEVIEEIEKVEEDTPEKETH